MASLSHTDSIHMSWYFPSTPFDSLSASFYRRYWVELVPSRIATTLYGLLIKSMRSSMTLLAINSRNYENSLLCLEKNSGVRSMF